MAKKTRSRCYLKYKNRYVTGSQKRAMKRRARSRTRTRKRKR